MNIQIAPSILSADFSILGDEVRAVEQAGADLIHIDVMDGHFVPNITIGPLVVKSLRPVTGLPLDVHLMISDPDSYIRSFANSGADYLTVHVETCTHLHRTIHAIKALGIKAGAVLNPATPPETLEYVLKDLDMVLIMSVNPGFGGQKFIRSSLEKIRKLKQMMSDQGCSFPVEVDGGINRDTIREAAAAGADIFVAGSAVFDLPDYREAIDTLKSLGRRGREEHAP
ncbi:MAG TPA: ribulose-phosphate 3-epimerase [Thermodesulfobacteriaceae bacterium]|nr:ribulose-phosphate 3-epimerase [Thermodesulfobacteriaceae bacterium]